MFWFKSKRKRPPKFRKGMPVLGMELTMVAYDLQEAINQAACLAVKLGLYQVSFTTGDDLRAVVIPYMGTTAVWFYTINPKEAVAYLNRNSKFCLTDAGTSWFSTLTQGEQAQFLGLSI